MSKVILIFLSCTLISCSTTHIKSSSNKPIKFGKKENHTNNIQMKLTKEFFLWGSIPFSHEIYIDKQMGLMGYESLSELEVISSKSTSDIIWSLVTFGVYWPQTYTIKGKTI